MTENEIIELWRQGYSVQQITQKSSVVKATKNNPDVTHLVQNRIERIILNYQS